MGLKHRLAINSFEPIFMKIYFDSSVYGGCFDPEFADASNELFRRAKAGWFKLVWSSVVEDEMRDAPPEVRQLFRTHTRRASSLKVPVTPKVAELASAYVAAKVLPQKMFNDGVHVALATVYNVAYLTTWDRKHLVAPARIVAFQEVNLTFGYNPVSIVTPQTLLE